MLVKTLIGNIFKMMLNIHKNVAKAFL